MQTFLTDHNLFISAKNLDIKRLGKQRVEAIQIAEIIVYDKKEGWSNHPAVNMWRGYEKYLTDIYIPIHMWMWSNHKKKNGEPYNNKKSLIRWSKLSAIVRDRDLVIPMWITDNFIEKYFLILN